MFVLKIKRVTVTLACLLPLLDVAMNRNCEIRDDSGEDYERARTFEAELSEYIEEPLLTNRSLNQLWVRDNHFDVLRYWRDKATDWPNLAFFCRCLYATMARSVIYASHISN
jgi:hypothetical protein